MGRLTLEGLYDWRNEATDQVDKQRSLALKQKMCRCVQ